MKPSMLRVALSWVVLSLAAGASAVSISGPSDLFVGPAEQVTLLFDLRSPTAVDVELEAIANTGWATSVTPSSISLEPDVPTSVTVTVDVPASAAAFTTERLTFRARFGDDAVESTVEMSVLEVIDLRLEAPTQAILGPEGLVATVISDGNSTQSVTLELRRGDTLLDARELTVVAGARLAVRFDLADEGEHTLRMQPARGQDVTRSVRSIRFGTPEPAPFGLSGSIMGAYGVGGEWDATFILRGRLSDFSSLDVRASATDWRQSFAAVTLEHAALRLGARGTPPFLLDLPKDFGVTASYQRDGWGVGGLIGLTGDDRLSSYVAGAWTQDSYSLAAGGGIRAGAAVASVRGTYTEPGLALVGTGRYQNARIDARLTANISGQESTTQLRGEVRDALTARFRVEFEARHRFGPTTLNAVIAVPVGPSANWDWRAGVTQVFDVAAPSSLQLALQAGQNESFARLSYRTDVGDDWRTTNVFGVRYDRRGFGVTLDSTWQWSGIDELVLGTKLAYRPSSGALEGQVLAKLLVVEDPVSLAVETKWNLMSSQVEASATLGLSEGDWQLDIDGSVKYGYARPTNPWTYDLGVALTYAFDVTVPIGLVEATGGRRLGTLVGSVDADGAPLAGVVVSVGRFRVLTDEQGRFELQVVPGTYRVSVDRSSLPTGYRIMDPAQVSVQIDLRTTHEVQFFAARAP